MVSVRPFRGVRYDPRRVRMDRAVCPPYDVIGERLARRLRAHRFNAIHIELPSGNGDKYRRAAGLWRRWNAEGVLASDAEPSVYVVEQRYRHGGRSYTRTGFLAALGLRQAGPAQVRPHERTLSKPKADRLKVLKTLKINTSPIFGLFRDPSGEVRAALAKARRAKPDASGVSADGVRFKLWKVSDPGALAAVERSFRKKSLLIADGHHRFEVAREYFRRHPSEASSSMLVYLCAEEDRGLVVLPTHRVVSPAEETLERIGRLCRLERKPGLAALLKALDRHPSPYAFGLVAGSRFELAAPKSAGGAKSGLCVEWLALHVAAHIDPHHIKYTHDAKEAVSLARGLRGAALLVKPTDVAGIRRAVDRIGLLPQKSTYFFPKITTGLVFKTLA